MKLSAIGAFSIHATVFCFVPVQAQIAVIGELSHDRQIRQGEEYSGIISLRNDTDEGQEAKVYQTDYLFHFSGTNNYSQPGSSERSNAEWITFSPSHVFVPPHSTAEVHYTVSVAPDSVEVLTGSYWSMIMVESIAKGSPESSLSPADDQPQMGIRQTIRYGVQIATHITGSGIKDIRFIDAKLIAAEGGDHFLQLDIENTGSIGMRPEVYVDLFGSNGQKRGRFEGTRYRLYPGTSVRHRIPLEEIDAGTYQALIVIDDGGEAVFGAQYTLEF